MAKASKRRTDSLLKVSDAARALGISLDTLRRWDKEGRIRCVRDDSNRRTVPMSEIERLRFGPPIVRTGTRFSARNRIGGVVTNVKTDGVMALVEVEAGPYLLAAAITRDAVEELQLVPGVAVIATIKATSVMVSREEGRSEMEGAFTRPADRAGPGRVRHVIPEHVVEQGEAHRARPGVGQQGLP